MKLRLPRLGAYLLCITFLVCIGAGRAYATTPNDGDTPYSWPGASILRVDVEPSSAGFVQSTPYLIDCPLACVRPFDKGTTVTLTAHPTTWWKFASWTGPCAGQENPCTITLDQSAGVQANFDYVGPPPRSSTGPFTLEVRYASNDIGLVADLFGLTSGGPTLICPFICSAQYEIGSEVLLVAGVLGPPDGPALGFEGCDSAVGPGGTLDFHDIRGTLPDGLWACILTMNSDRTVTASFGPGTLIFPGFD
jgi:hypothetical protein